MGSKILDPCSGFLFSDLFLNLEHLYGFVFTSYQEGVQVYCQEFLQ